MPREIAVLYSVGGPGPRAPPANQLSRRSQNLPRDAPAARPQASFP